MSLADLSFKFYTDSGLTTAFAGLYQLTHYTDLSDNPQDFTLYFGSTETGRTLEAVSNPGVDNITLTPTLNSDAWAGNTAYSLGNLVIPTTPNGYIYECTTAGTSSTASTEPTWPTGAIGDTVVDNTVIWTMVSASHPVTEIKLATSSGTLSSATAGAALSLGTTLSSGSGNAFPVYMRITNTVATVGDNTGYPELNVTINSVQETG